MIHIGVLSPVTGGFYFGDILSGVVREVAAVGGHVTLIQTLDAGQSGDEVLAAPEFRVPVGWDHIDGFVTIIEAASVTYLRQIREAGIPVVVVSNHLDVDAATVVPDNHTGVRNAVTHLVVDHGHQGIAFLGNLSQTDMVERLDAYRAGLAEHGLPDELFIATSDHVESGGHDAAAAVAAAVARGDVTAVVASTDRIALGLMSGLTELGVQIPHDVAVVGFDNAETGWHSSPPLATVNQETVDQGALAARLLLAEMDGEPVDHGRHSISSTLLPRRSCGCGLTAASGAEQAALDGAAIADLVAEVLGVCAGTVGADPPAETPPVDAAELDGHISAALSTLYPTAQSPETIERFTDSVVTRLGELARGLGTDIARRNLVIGAVVRISVVLSRLQAVTGLKRSQKLTHSMVEQYDVGMGLLGGAGADPSALEWLRRVSVRLACLALWDGPPQDNRLRVASVYDPDGQLTEDLPETLAASAFPPVAMVERTDASRTEVTFVIPVRGTSGDHGMLCLIGEVDTTEGTGRATYNHWAALLGVALKQEGLLEEIRRSEERYSLASSATHDGLWDWDVAAGACYYSQRCQSLLGIAQDRAVDDRPRPARRGDVPELAPWTDAVHPDDLAELRAELRRAVADGVPFEVEHRVRRPDGGYRWVLCRALPVAEPRHSARRVVGSITDIHHRKELEEQLRQAALYDTVTGLPNRRLFLDRLTWAVEQSQRRNGSRFAVVFLDLDGFKLINDSLGHLAGDELLSTIGRRLRDDLRSVDTAARFGGDEFAVLLFDLKHEAVLSIVDRIQCSIATPVVLGGHEVAITASVGIATSETGYTDAEDVLRDADIAMYHAKEAERGTASVFDPQMHSRATGRLRAQSELRAALVEHQFVVQYQPVVALDGSPLTQFEALVRWDHPTSGILLPGEFLPLMAESGTIVALGQWIIDEVVGEVARWRRTYAGPVSVSVNLSHREFWSEQLLITVTQALSRHDVPPSCLVLEITESVIMTDPQAARQVMADLHAAGVRLHIDDFGTGQSSLNALRAFPVDALKIDQSFVQQLDLDIQTTELVRIIVAMGRALGIEVVAEGVETEAQADELRAMGCVAAQGWLYAPSVSGDEAGAMLGAPLPARPRV